MVKISEWNVVEVVYACTLRRRKPPLQVGCDSEFPIERILKLDVSGKDAGRDRVKPLVRRWAKRYTKAGANAVMEVQSQRKPEVSNWSKCSHLVIRT
jgi:hypothetical protein